MKTFLPLHGVLAGAFALSSCADAPVGPPPPAYRPAVWDIQHRIGWIQQRINRGAASGALPPGEFNRVQGILNNIRREFRSDLAVNGGRLDGPTRADLEARLDNLNAQIRWIHEMNEARPW